MDGSKKDGLTYFEGQMMPRSEVERIKRERAANPFTQPSTDDDQRIVSINPDLPDNVCGEDDEPPRIPAGCIIFRMDRTAAAAMVALMEMLAKPFPAATHARRRRILEAYDAWVESGIPADGRIYMPMRCSFVPPQQVRGLMILQPGGDLPVSIDQWPEVDPELLAGMWEYLTGGNDDVEAGDVCEVGESPEGAEPGEDEVQASPALETDVCAVSGRDESVPAGSSRVGEGVQSGGSVDEVQMAPEPVADVVSAAVEDGGDTKGRCNEETPSVATAPMDAGAETLPDEPGVEAAEERGQGCEPEEQDVGAGENAACGLWSLIPQDKIAAAEAEALYRYVEQIEKYGAKVPRDLPWMDPEAIRAWVAETAASERVRRAYEVLEEERRKAEEKALFDSFYSISEKGVVHLDYAAIGAHLRELFFAVTFNKTVYIYDAEEGIYIENSGQIECAVQEIAERVMFSGKITGVKREVLSYVKDHNVVTDYPFNQYLGLPASNGVIVADLDACRFDLVPYGPEMFFTYKLPVVYDPDAPTDAIDAVLKQWVEPDDVRTLYQIPAQAVLHQLSRKKPYKKCYILQGDQDAGKTTYLELLFCTFGTGNCAKVSLQRIGNDRFYKGALEGKVLNVYDDLSDVPFHDTGELKTVTGLFEHEIERKGRDSYPGRIFAVHVFTCNKPPAVDDRNKADSAFWGRWEYLTFPNSFPKDPSFYDRTFTPENVSGFLNAVLKTALDIVARGTLLVDSSAYEVRDRWSYNSDPIYRFREENLERNAAGKIPKEDLWNAFLRYASYEEIDAAKIPASPDAFAKKIFNYDFWASKESIDGKRVPVFTGYTWLPTSRYRPGGATQAALGGGK